MNLEKMLGLGGGEGPLNGIKNPLLGLENQVHTLILHLHPKLLCVLHHLHLPILHPYKILSKRPYLRCQFRYRSASSLLLFFLFLFHQLPTPFPNRIAFIDIDISESIDNSRPLEYIINTPGPTITVVFLLFLLLLLLLIVVVHIDERERACGNGKRSAVERVHEVEVWPRGRGRGRALLLGAVTLAELLDLVATLEGGLGGRFGVIVAATGGDSYGDLFPIGSFELAAF